MIVASLDIDDLFKAAKPDTPARGGKYIKREWSGERWKYTYSDEKSGAHGPTDVADIKDPTLAHSIDVVVNSTTDDPEKAYKAALDKALSEPGSEHPVASPKGGEDMKLEVYVTSGGVRKLRLSDDSGKKVKDFSSRGAYEMWHMGTANTTTQLDTEGNAFLDIRPNVGSVKNGELVPTTGTNPGWIVQYNKSYPKDNQGTKKKWFKTSRENAESFANKMYRDELLASGKGIPEKNPDFGADEKKAESDGKGVTKFAPPGSVADKMQVGDPGWKVNPETKKRELDATPEEREKLVSQAAVEYWGVLSNMADQMASGSFFNDRKDYWKAKFLGVSEVPKGKPDAVALDPGSPARDAIERALDTYDPASPAGFTGYLVGKSKKGLIYWKMRNARDNPGGFVDEVKATGSMETGGSESKSRLDTATSTPDPQDYDSWSSSVETLLNKWEESSPNENPKVRDMARQALNEVDSMLPGSDRQMSSAQELSDLLQQLGVTKYVQKALVSSALETAMQEDLFNKALNVLTKDKGVAPEHQYSHVDGDETNPRHYYTDQLGNQIRYTNAPTGHKDRSSYHGDASLHSSEPDFSSNPEYFSPTGQKLTRCPECEVEQVEWNESYNRYDPQNLWAGRWTDPASGQARYTYIDADLRSYPKFQIHQQNAMVDVRLPRLRQYISSMFNDSDRLKDQITALALALMDQGRMRAVEIASLTTADISIEGSIVKLGKRKIHASDSVKIAIETLVRTNSGDGPLFSVPLQSTEGDINRSLSRRLGPYYLSQVLENQGVSLLGLQTYHATLCFIKEARRLVTRASWDQVVSSAVLASALEWGHDFSQETDTPQILQLAQAVLIDPVVIEAVKQKAESDGLINEVQISTLPPIMIPIPTVSFELVDRTADELEFSQWLHSHPIHEHVTKSVYSGKGTRTGSPGNYKYTYDNKSANLRNLKNKIGESVNGKTFEEQHQIAENFINKHNARLVGILDDLKNLSPAGADIKGRVKTIESAMGKLIRKPDLYPTAEALTDATGSRVIVDSVQDVRNTVENIRQTMEVVDEKDYITTPQGNYRSHHIIIKDSDGLSKEIQVRTKNQDIYASWAHDIYKPVNAAQEQAMASSANSINEYSTQMSQYLFAKDTGQPLPPTPQCPQIVADSFGCLTV